VATIAALSAVLFLSPGTQGVQVSALAADQAPDPCKVLVAGVANAGTPGIVLPVQTRKVEAKYSPAAYVAKASRVVVVCAIVNERGRIERRAIKRSENPLLDPEALKAVGQWRFTPARLDGKPVAIVIEAEVVFKIR
jgi:TonB family protein